MHCALGKDRTGFVSLLLEMLAGADYQEMLDDYMLSYESFYRVTESSDPAKYEMIREKYFNVMIRHIVNDESADPQTAFLIPYAEQYLLEGGMSRADLDSLQKCHHEMMQKKTKPWEKEESSFLPVFLCLWLFA